MFDVLDAGDVNAETTAAAAMKLYDDTRRWQILVSKEAVRQVLCECVMLCEHLVCRFRVVCWLSRKRSPQS